MKIGLQQLQLRLLQLLIFFSMSVAAVAQKAPNLAATPPMGWNSWNTFATNINEELVKGIADSMVSTGMLKAGYNYLVLDDGWMAMERDAKTGDLMADPKKFPSGMKALADYVHSKGLKFGLYNCAGTKTCAGYPGTRGYEYQDARLYASWGVDFLKYDWCSTEGINAKEAYGTMSKALAASGRAILFSLCEWGDNQPWNWGEPFGHMWRISGDIYPCFDCEHNHGTWSSWGVTKILDMRKNIRQFSGPAHWNDFDMMEVGNLPTEAENRSHFSMWCMVTSPLIAGNDVRKMSASTRQILTHPQAISINQDVRGVQGYLYQQVDSVDTWIKPLANGEIAVCFLNRATKTKTIDYDWKQHPIADTVSKTNVSFTQTSFTYSNIWQPKQTGHTGIPLQASIASHDVVMLRLTPKK